MKRNSGRFIAFGGMMAALALVIMCLGGIIPVATYVCPMLCAVLLCLVLKVTTVRIAWAWYGAVALLSLLIGPDKEAAAVFVFLGYYPIIKPWLDRRKLAWLWKLAVFNAAILVMYTVLIYLLGMEQVVQEFEELGVVLTVVTLIMGNITLFMLDIILGRFGAKYGKK